MGSHFSVPPLRRYDFSKFIKNKNVENLNAYRVVRRCKCTAGAENVYPERSVNEPSLRLTYMNFSRHYFFSQRFLPLRGMCCADRTEIPRTARFVLTSGKARHTQVPSCSRCVLPLFRSRLLERTSKKYHSTMSEVL